jgi:hypothetical protein
MISELGHYSVHCPFVFFEQHAKLLIFMEECLVLNYYLSIHALDLRLERFCLRNLAIAEKKIH